MARAAFNWAGLTRSVLIKQLSELRDRVVDQTISVTELTRLLKKHIRSHLPVSITSSRYAPVPRNTIWLGGVYDSELDRKKRKRFIEVQLAFSPQDRRLHFSHYRFHRLCRRYADLILHEVIHCRQFRARKFKAIPGYQSTAIYAQDRREQEYYGDLDEMGAHAFNIACNLVDRYGLDRKKCIHYLNNTPRRYKKATAWQDYLQAFNWNHGHYRVRKMKTLIIRNLEMAATGKPFRNNNFLTY